jgi:K(+)-stimulated pyrophosphate-energized sodium pump
MCTWIATATSVGCRIRKTSTWVLAFFLSSTAALAQTSGETAGGEASLKLPDLSQVTFVGGMDGHKLLMIGLLFCVFGL